MPSTYKTFPTKDFPIGKYRAFVSECYADEIAEGYVKIYCELMLISHITKDTYFFYYPIVNDRNNPRSMEFFDAIGFETLEWEQYSDLVGLTFDCKISREQYAEKVVPVLTNIKLLTTNIPIED